MGYLKGKDAEKAYGLSKDALRQRRLRGTLDAHWDGRQWHYAPPEGMTYPNLVKGWQDGMRRGLLNGISCKENTVESRGYGLLAFWRALKQSESIQAITVENIQQACANEEKPSVKENIYKSMMGLYRYMIHLGLREEREMLRFKQFKPKKRKIRRTFIRPEEYQELLKINHSWRHGRREYDRFLAEMILTLLWNTGLRSTEACNFKWKDICFKTGRVFVWDGKNGKDDIIGLTPELAKAAKLWWTERRAESQTDYLLVQIDGKQMTRRTIAERVRDLAKRMEDKDLTPHGFRRGLLTDLLVKGESIALVKKVARHSSIKSLAPYDMTEDEQAWDLMRNRGSAKPQRSRQKVQNRPIMI